MSKPRRFGLKGRLLILIFLAFVPALILSSIHSLHQFQNQKATANENMLRLTRVMKMSHRQMLDDTQEFLVAISSAPPITKNDTEECRAFMNRLVQSFNGYMSLGVATSDGTLICSSTPSKLQNNVANQEFFKDAVVKRSLGTGRYKIDLSSGKPIVFLGLPILNEENEVDKVIFAALDLSHFDTLVPAAHLAHDSVIMIFDEAGLILACIPDPMGCTGTSQPSMPLLKNILDLASEEGVTNPSSAGEVARLYAYTKIHHVPGQTVFLAVGMSTASAYGAAKDAFLMEMGSLAFASFLVFAIAWVGSDFLVLRKMQMVIHTADRIRDGDLHARSGLTDSRDEVDHLGHAFDTMADAMQQRMGILQRHDAEMHELLEMNEAMQACITQAEVLIVIREYVSRLFPIHAVGLYLLHESGDYLEEKVSWNNPASMREFSMDDCWAMRRGQSYLVNKAGGKQGCGHVIEPVPECYLCLPLIVHGQIMGLLHLQDATFPKPDSESGSQQMARTVADQITLVLANMKLRDMLQTQATRDGLTGLFNRRFMEETLIREARNADRNKLCISIIMLDLDHFKHFNDKYGHAAGDALLREAGSMLQNTMRGGDLACRYGGEEFVIILPDTSLQQAASIAEALRESIRRLKVEFHGKELECITVSIGVASYPQHGKTWETALHAADLALMAAKSTRDRVVVCDA